MPFRLLVAVVFEVFVAAGTIVAPYLGFVFYLFWVILRPQDDRPHIQALHYPMVLLVATLAGTVPRMVKEQSFSSFAAIRKLGLIFLYFVLMVFSALASGYTPLSSRRVGEFSIVVLICLMIQFWGSSEHAVWGMLCAFGLAGVQIARDALTRATWMHEQIGGEHFDRLNMNRLNGNFGSPNYIGLLMAVLVLMGLNFLYARYPVWLKLGVSGALGVFVYVFLKANSRGASLGLAAGLIAMFLLQKRKALTMILLLFVGGAVLAIAPASYFDRLKTIGNYRQDASATSRLELWNTGLQLVKAHPLLGVGPDNFTLYAPNSPHDAYVQAAAEMGLPAALLYCVILISGFSAAFSAVRSSARLPDGANLRAFAVAMLCVMAQISVQGLTTGLAHREFVYFFVTLCYAAQTIGRKRVLELAPQPIPYVAPATVIRAH